mgnify:CR=1 FL=1
MVAEHQAARRYVLKRVPLLEEHRALQERQEGRFVRTIRLPAAVQEDKVIATYADGVLTVRLPKAAPAMMSVVQFTAGGIVYELSVNQLLQSRCTE